MSPLEKKLSLIAAALLGLLGLAYSANFVYNAFTRRQKEIAQLEKQLSDARFQVQRGVRVADRINEYAQKALPPARDKALSLYRSWLIELASELQIQDTKVNPTTQRSVQDTYDELTFTLEGKADLEQLTRLLYEIQFAPILHSVRSLVVQPIRDRRELAVNLTLVVAAMRGAPDRAKLPRASDVPDVPSLNDYLQPILSRNLFGPENNPPRLRVDPEYVIFRGQPFELVPRAEDPDKFDQVEVRIDADGVPGARIGSGGGRFSWMPQQTGEYWLEVRARDNGFPPQEATQRVKLVVREPPPRAPGPPAQPAFNPAKFAFITAVTQVGDQPQVWVTLRTEGRTLKLSVGEKFRIGDFEGQIVAVEGRQVVIRSRDNTITARLGESLIQ